MFNKELKEKLEAKIRSLELRIYELREESQAKFVEDNKLVSCKKCGCLLYKIGATCVSKLEEKEVWEEFVEGNDTFGEFKNKVYIKEEYYCKIHKPKISSKKNK